MVSAPQDRQSGPNLDVSRGRPRARRPEGRQTSVACDTEECEWKVQADFTKAERARFNLSQPPAERGAGTIFVIRALTSLKAIMETVQACGDGESITFGPQEAPWGTETAREGREQIRLRDPDGSRRRCLCESPPDIERKGVDSALLPDADQYRPRD